MRPLPAGLGREDWDASATVRDLSRLDSALEIANEQAPSPGGTLLDLGCGIGGLSLYVAAKLGLETIHGVDVDRSRLARARDRGLETHQLDLNSERLPLGEATVDVCTSFGAFEHFVWYDNTVSEVSRVLRPDGIFIMSMPNLGSYVNRIGLLLGYQPRDVEISQQTFAGMLPRYKNDPTQHPLAHVHSATLRAMTELLDHYGMTTIEKLPFSPDHGSKAAKIADRFFGRIPSWSRRFILVAQKR